MVRRGSTVRVRQRASSVFQGVLFADRCITALANIKGNKLVTSSTDDLLCGSPVGPF
jgi:hypothetical protein